MTVLSGSVVTCHISYFCFLLLGHRNVSVLDMFILFNLDFYRKSNWCDLPALGQNCSE